MMPQTAAAPMLPVRAARTGDRILVLGAGFAYFWLLYYIYLGPLRAWDYLGFPLGNYSAFDLVCCLAYTMVPGALMPTTIRRFSAFINWCIYFFVYVPAVLYPVLQGLRPDVLSLSTSIFASFLIIIGLTAWRMRQIRITISPRTWRSLFVVGALGLTAYALSVFGGALTLSDITDVYGQRSLAGDIAEGTLVGYATGILSGCFNPLLMSLGLRYRKPWLLALGAAGQVFVYAAFAQKSTLLSPAVILGFWMLSIRGREITARGIAIFCLLIAVAPISTGLFVSQDDSVLYENVVAIIYMRTFGMVGAITGTYFDFFSTHSYTLYSHINIIGKFMHYPYADPVGVVIGNYMVLDMNANANFWATDGIAAAGLVGILLIGVIMGLAMRVFDAMIPDDNLAIACGAAGPDVMSLANSSFFTTLLTSGLLVLIFFSASWRRATRTPRPSHERYFHENPAERRHLP